MDSEKEKTTKLIEGQSGQLTLDFTSQPYGSSTGLNGGKVVSIFSHQDLKQRDIIRQTIINIKSF